MELKNLLNNNNNSNYYRDTGYSTDDSYSKQAGFTNNYPNQNSGPEKKSIKEKLKFLKPSKKLLVVLGVAVPLVLVFAWGRGKTLGTETASSVVSSQKSRESKATIEVGKTFTFNAVNAAKEEVPIKFTITTVERKDEIKVKDEPKKTTAGRDFLLVRIELQNDATERVAIATTDRIRLEEAGKLYAPDYHNGNVVIDPISVRRDLVAFIVDTDQKEFSFLVGELAGEKQKIQIKF